MTYISKWYYLLTKYIPRKLPTTDEEFKQLKALFTSVYGLEDHPKVWYTVASQLTAGPPTSLYRSYGKMINAALKLNVMALAQLEKHYANEDLILKLKEKTEEVALALKEEETSHEATTASDDEPPILPFGS